MREQARLPEYYKYLTEKFEWPQNTTDQIDWRVIELAMNRFTPQDRIRIRKIIHEWIPTRVSPGNNPSEEIDRLCPSCKRHHETPEHLLRCDAPNRRLHLATLRAKLVTLFTKHQIDPYIYQMWWLGLTTLDNPTDHHMGLYPAQYQPIHRSQSKIGWKQLYYGRLTKQWTHFLTMNQPEIDAAKFYAKLLQEVWTYELEIWKTRNADQTIATADIPPNMWSDIQGIFAAKDHLL